MQRNATYIAHTGTAILISIVGFCFVANAGAQIFEWPQKVQGERGTATIYQPQLDELKGNTVRARSAVSLTSDESTVPLFGTMWISARFNTDRANQVVKLDNVTVEKAAFPGSDTQLEEMLVSGLNSLMKPGVIHGMSLERFAALTATLENPADRQDRLLNDPPAFAHSKVPAVLVTLDGDPKLHDTSSTGVMQVINTPVYIALDVQEGNYYLFGRGSWATAKAVEGPWSPAGSDTVPNVVKLAAGLDIADNKPGAYDDVGMPAIVVAKQPTELIVTDGDAEMTPIPGTDLLYVANTESDVFLHLETEMMYVLVSGRWYEGNAVEAPWVNVAPNALPADFAKIPVDSPKANVLVSVAGTPQAQQAVLESGIPQTAAIRITDMSFVPVFDGAPQFVDIEGTNLKYAINTPDRILEVAGLYYACDAGVWYKSQTAEDGYSVATEVPESVYSIPASSPVYPLTHVHIYESTPEIVYVGYTPGYTGTYIYGGVPVYGTGYSYPAWNGSRYYPRPNTWGVAAAYNSSTGGWGIAIGAATPYGWFRGGSAEVGVAEISGWAYNGIWGSHVEGDVDVDWDEVDWTQPKYQEKNNIRINNDTNLSDNNIYGNRVDHVSGLNTNGIRFKPNDIVDSVKTDVADGLANASHVRPANPAQSGSAANNIYSDKQGNIFRPGLNGWEQHDNQTGQWSGKARQLSTTPNQKSPAVKNELNAAHTARSNGQKAEARRESERQHHQRQQSRQPQTIDQQRTSSRQPLSPSQQRQPTRAPQYNQPRGRQ